MAISRFTGERRTYLRRGEIVRHLSVDEDEFITARYVAGTSFKETARLLSLKFHHRRTAHTVMCRLVALNVHQPKARTRKVTAAERARILELAATGLKAWRISPIVGRARGTVWHVMSSAPRVPPLYTGRARMDPFRSARES